MINYSILWKDRKHLKLQKLSFAQIYNNCKSLYNKDKAIEAAAAEYSRRISEGKKLIKEARSFDFLSLCFFYGYSCYTKKDNTRIVQNDHTRIKILDSIEQRKINDFLKEIHARLQNMTNLKDYGCYHCKCVILFKRNFIHCWTSCERRNR